MESSPAWEKFELQFKNHELLENRNLFYFVQSRAENSKFKDKKGIKLFEDVIYNYHPYEAQELIFTNENRIFRTIKKHIK
jgi:hypothetical protein